MPFASVYVSNEAGTITGEAHGTTANSDGDFMIDTEPGEYLTASFVGYLKQTKPVMQDSGIINFALDASTLPEATIYGKPSEINWKLLIAALIVAALIYAYYNY